MSHSEEKRLSLGQVTVRGTAAGLLSGSLIYAFSNAELAVAIGGGLFAANSLPWLFQEAFNPVIPDFDINDPESKGDEPPTPEA